MSDLFALPPVAERVLAGLDFLDRAVPGWDKKINLYKLDLSSCIRCVLGQLFGSYGDGEDALELTSWDCVRLGFDRHCGEPAVVHNELTSAWLDAIRVRRGAVSR